MIFELIKNLILLFEVIWIFEEITIMEVILFLVMFYMLY